MKVALVLAATLILGIAIPGSHQGKGKKPKFCLGKDGNRYKKGKGYEDKEACIRYTCIKKGKKLKMTEEKIKKCPVTTTTPTTTTSMTPAPSTTTTEGESEPGLAANVTALEASVQFLNGSVESMENKLEVLQSNVESLQTSVVSIQTSVESILGMMTTMQSTSSKLEVNITSNMDAISSNTEGISTNNNGINKNKDACLAIETTAAKLETCLGDVNSTDCPSSEDGKISVVDAIKQNKEDMEACEACEACEKPKFNLVMTAGDNGGLMATSEIIGPGGVCSQSIPPLPVALTGPQSVYFNNTLMVCGGQYTSGYTNTGKCHQLRDSNSEWTEGPAMSIPRRYFSMTKAGQDLYALGGYDYDNGGNLDSMDKLSGSSGEWTMMEQKLPSPRHYHCTVFMETTRSLVIIGGKPSTNLVEEFRVATKSWKELTPLPLALYGHACAQLDQTIVVTGGWSGGASQKKVYTFAGGNWEMTGQLQVARHYPSMATLDNKLLVLGGAYDYVDTIEEMKEDGSFQIMEWKLNEKRAYATITQAPRQMFPC